MNPFADTKYHTSGLGLLLRWLYDIESKWILFGEGGEQKKKVYVRCSWQLSCYSALQEQRLRELNVLYRGAFPSEEAICTPGSSLQSTSDWTLMFNGCSYQKRKRKQQRKSFIRDLDVLIFVRNKVFCRREKKEKATCLPEVSCLVFFDLISPDFIPVM